MQIIAVSGKKEQGKTITASLLPFYLSDRRCFIMSYYEAVEYVSPGICKYEYESVKSIIGRTCPKFFIDSIKLKQEVYKGIYDVLIIDDVERESEMQKLKAELGALIIGVVKDFPYSVPYKARNELSSDVLGSPDIVIKNEMTINRLHKSIKETVDKLKSKNLI